MNKCKTCGHAREFHYSRVDSSLVSTPCVLFGPRDTCSCKEFVPMDDDGFDAEGYCRTWPCSFAHNHRPDRYPPGPTRVDRTECLGVVELGPESMDQLSFADLKRANIVRTESGVFGPGTKLMEWSPADWVCALAGEVGEAANLIKKARRDGYIDEGRRLNIAKELADVAIYLDLLASRLSIDLGKAVRDKFNEVSDKRGSKVRL